MTGIPMEFQFGTNWARFSKATGGVIGQPLVMEGVFSFFFGVGLSRALPLPRAPPRTLGTLVDERRPLRWLLALRLLHHRHRRVDATSGGHIGCLPNGTYEVSQLLALTAESRGHGCSTRTTCPAPSSRAHFVMAAVGALYLLQSREGDYGRIFLQASACMAGLISCIAQIFRTGDLHGKYVANHQPAAMAGMEGLFHTEKGAPIVLMGQPDIEAQKIDNPLAVNRVLSFLIYGTTAAEVRGLDQFPRDQWPSALPLLFYSYHIMAGLGTYFVALMVVAGFLLWRGKLYTARWVLWPILLSFPLPYIANTAGWMTAEIGRQPWLVYGLLRTSEGYSKHIGAGTSLFTLLGFLGLYTVLSILWIVLVYTTIQKGPSPAVETSSGHSLTTA